MDFKDITKNFLDMATPKRLRDWIDELINKVDELTVQNSKKDKKISELEAQIRKLQGLPAKPSFDSKDKTSELDKDDEGDDGDDPDKKKRERRRKAAKKNRRKKKGLEVDTKRKLSVDPKDLDATFEYKGTRKVVVQDIVFQRNNIEFELEKFYSPEYKKTVEADLPAGYEGSYFGPTLIALVKATYYEGDMTIKKIRRFLESIGIQISNRQINRIINDRPDELVEEMERAREAAIEKEGYQQIDDTGAKILGEKSAYTTVTCNPSFSSFYTSLTKNRANAVMALAGGNKSPLYKINLQAILVAFTSLKSLDIQLLLEKYEGEKVYTEEELSHLFNQEEFIKLKPPTLRDIKTAMLIGAFYDGHLGITGKALVSDDAPQFNNIFDDHILCWYHEMRHYKNLLPTVKMHQMALDSFWIEIKEFYKILKGWTQTRSKELGDELFAWFNTYFTWDTGYRMLDERKRMTFAKLAKLLGPLWTEVMVPLTNNESERDLRGKVIKKKISQFDRTWEGVRARDLNLSLKHTCRKNGVSFYKFLLDRQTRAGQIPQLSAIIQGI